MTFVELDPFDLPEWLGEEAVTWAAEGGLGSHVVAGSLMGVGGQRLPCDLLAVDDAYPAPVVNELLRTRVHQSWRHGQVLILSRAGRATIAAPGTTWTPERILEAFTRVARAVGAAPTRWSVQLMLNERPDR